MRAAGAARLLVPAAALIALLAVPLTSPGKAPVQGLLQAPLAASITPITTTPANTVTDRLVGINDVHGYLQSGAAGSLYGTVAGGIRQLTREVETLQTSATTTAGKQNVSVVGGGDMIGASPLISALYNDEPTIDALHDLNLDYTSVGNHEFDRGLIPLKRQQDGGCNLTAANSSPSLAAQQCTFTYNDDYKGASSQAAGSYAGLGRKDSSDSPSQAYDNAGITSGYLAANVVPNPGGSSAAGVTEPASNSAPTSYPAPIFPAYGIKTFPNGSKVGYIGEVLAGTPGIVTAAGVQGLAFLDEATTANYYAKQLQAQGVNTIVLLIHQGGSQSGSGTSVDTCGGFTGDLQPILSSLSSAISVVVSAHTHQAYDCSIPEPSGTKLVTSAAKYSQAVTSIDLTVTPYTGDATGDQLVSAAAKNVTVDTHASTYEPAATPATFAGETAAQMAAAVAAANAAASDTCSITRNSSTSYTDTPVATSNSSSDPLYFHEANIQCAAEAESDGLANTVEGNITGDLLKTAQGPSGNYAGDSSDSGFGESQLGDAVMDGQLADAQAKDPTVIAGFTNSGGLRNNLLVNPPNNPVNPGQVTYGETFSVQPFGNYLVTMNLTGAQLLTVLQQQFKKCNAPQFAEEFLQPSGITYTVNYGAPSCAALLQNVRVGVPIGSDSTTAGTALDPSKTYKIVVNNFLAGGGDNFPGFTAGTNMTYGDVDEDALNAYLQQHNTNTNGDTALTPPADDRVLTTNGNPSTFNPSSAAAALPEAPLAISLPVIAVLLGGGTIALRRRRRSAAAPAVLAITE